MSLQSFAYMSLAEKLDFVCERGTFLMERQTDIYHVSLFACRSFYAEIWYHSICQEVDYVRAFRSKEILEPYLAEISIDSLLQKPERSN